MKTLGRYVTIQGGLVGRPTGLEFDPSRDYTYCRICGVVFQPALNRVPLDEYTAEVIFAANIQRREWSQKHARQHTPREHKMLELSGRHCTPEALEVLVTYGIIPVSDIVMDGEHEHAGLQAPRAPVNDVEGARY